MAAEVCVEIFPQPSYRRHSKSRPLGAMPPSQSRHACKPSVTYLARDEVDVCDSSRNCHAKTASEIISEQQRHIHATYCSRNRKVKSAPASRRRHSQNTGDERAGKWALKSLYVKGIKSGSQELVYQSDTRPITEPARQTPTINRAATKARPTPDDSLDPELESHYNAFHELNTLIRDGWQIGFLEDVGLEQRTHRPKPYSAGHDVIRRRGYHWVGENGVAERSRSAGFIEDYLDDTAMADLPMEYYSIDRRSGIHTPKPLAVNKTGNRFLVGVNGAVRSLRNKVTRRRKTEGSTDDEDQEETSCEDHDPRPPDPVPLCWSDQLSRPGSRIIEARRPRTCQPAMGVYERHAVVFRSQTVVKPAARSPASGVAANGYRVKSRSNSCRGILGRSSNKIIHISIDRKTADEEEEIDKLSYDKILDSYRSGQSEEEEKTVSTESTVPLLPSVDSESRELLFGEQRDPDVHKTVAFERAKTWASSRPISVPSGRPTTALSRVSSYDLESEVWTIGGTCCRTPSSLCDARGVSGRSQRSMSALSSQKARPSVQKSVVASSMPSISSHPPQNGTSEYIQFAHKMKVPKEFTPTKSRTQTKPQPRVRSPARADAQLRAGKTATLQTKIPPPAPPTSVQDTMTASSEAEKQPSSTLLMVEERPSSPVDQLVAITPDTKYAFNIPTAELVAESENNSLDDDDAEEFATNPPTTESESGDEDRQERNIEEMATRLVEDVLSQLQNDSEETWTSTTFITAD